MNENLRLRKNNFDLIRFVGAILVVWFHSFPLTGTSNSMDPITAFTAGQSSSGAIGVMIFFIISGFLITMSYDRSNNLLNYSKARILRIFPAYLVVILICVFILGPLVTSINLKDYFSDAETYRYIKNIGLKKSYYTLPGVFLNNVYPAAVNGSIWTLWFEFFYYIIVAILGKLKLLNKPISLCLFVAAFLRVAVMNSADSSYSYFALFFFAGMFFYLWRDVIKLEHVYAVIALIALGIGTYLGFFKLSAAVFGTYFLFYLSLGPVPMFPNFSKYGDFSYGIYIYSFPIQQLVSHLSKNQIGQMGNFLLTVPLALVCAYFSWHLVEKTALSYKKTKIFGIL